MAYYYCPYNISDSAGFTIQLVGGVHHCVCISIGVADEVNSILLAEQSSAGSERGQSSDEEPFLMQMQIYSIKSTALLPLLHVI